jgi:hypothetical protein
MVIKIEIFVFNPIGAIQPQRYFMQFPAKMRYQRNPFGTKIAEMIKPEFWSLTTIEHDQTGSMLIYRTGFTGDKHYILFTHLFGSRHGIFLLFYLLIRCSFPGTEAHLQALI